MKRIPRPCSDLNKGISEDIVISIQPKWVSKFDDGSKTDELRKTSPAHIKEFPFKVFIYETKPGAGSVVAEADCIDITITADTEKAAKATAVPIDIAQKYLNGGDARIWHFENYKRYDKPLPITDFGMEKAPQSWCYAR